MNKKKDNNKSLNEELILMESVENEEWLSVNNLETEKARFEEMAKSALKKDKRLNIRVPEYDLNLLQKKASQEGIPYQTLIASLIHRYITGQLVDAKVLKFLLTNNLKPAV